MAVGNKKYPLPEIPAEEKTGDESFLYEGEEQFNLRSFWKWSGSNLLSNAFRGMMAEYIVARALGIDCKKQLRREWDAVDMTMLLPDNTKIKVEVKSSAYIQSWSQEKFSTLSFGVGKTEGWDSETNESMEKGRHANVYVFCVLAHKDQKTIDPLNLDQWDFYVIATDKLERNLNSCDQESIGITILRRWVDESLAQKCDYAGIKAAVTGAANATNK